MNDLISTGEAATIFQTTAREVKHILRRGGIKPVKKSKVPNVRSYTDSAYPAYTIMCFYNREEIEKLKIKKEQQNV